MSRTAEPAASPERKGLSPRQRQRISRWHPVRRPDRHRRWSLACSADWAGDHRTRSSTPRSPSEASARTLFTVALRNTVIYTRRPASCSASSFGTVLALMRLSSVAPYRWIATVYIEFFRGLPALLVFFLVGRRPAARLPGAADPRRRVRPGRAGPRAGRRRVHGGDVPGRHPGGAQGADGGGPLARHAAHAGRWSRSSSRRRSGS